MAKFSGKLALILDLGTKKQGMLSQGITVKNAEEVYSR